MLTALRYRHPDAHSVPPATDADSPRRCHIADMVCRLRLPPLHRRRLTLPARLRATTNAGVRSMHPGRSRRRWFLAPACPRVALASLPLWSWARKRAAVLTCFAGWLGAARGRRRVGQGAALPGHPWRRATEGCKFAFELPKTTFESLKHQEVSDSLLKYEKERKGRWCDVLHSLR